MQVEEFDREKKNLAWKMTTDKGLQDNDKISRVCVKLLVFIFLTKKSHKIHSIQESIKIYRLLNTSRQFISHEKSQLNTNGFCCHKKKVMIVLIEYNKICLHFIKVMIEYH